VAVIIGRSIRLRDGVAILLVSRKIDDIITDLGHHANFRIHVTQGGDLLRQLGVNRRSRSREHGAVRQAYALPQNPALQELCPVGETVDHPPIRGLDEAELVDASVGCQRTNQTNIGTFRCLDRADAAIVAVVNVADIKTRPLAAQTARAQRAQAALVSQLSQGIGLVHELAQL